MLTPENKALFKKRQYMYYWLNALLANILPIIIVGVRYKVIGPASPGLGYTITILGIVGAVWLVLKFWNDFVDWVYDLDEGLPREILLSLSKVGPYIMIIIVIVFSSMFLKDVQFIAYTLGLGKFLGVFFSAKHQYYKRALQVDRGDRRVLKDGRK